MDTKTKEMYSEVYGILEALGDDYIKRLPKDLYELIKKSKLDTYNPKYNIDTLLQDKTIKRETFSMIALFHYNYWCDSEEEKENLKKIFEENDKKQKAILKEKYDLNKVLNKDDVKAEEVESKELAKENEKLNLFKKIIGVIKKFFSVKR